MQPHPFGHQAPAARDDPHDPVGLPEDGQGSGRYAAVDGHEIDPHPGLVLDVREDGVLGEVLAGEAAGEEFADGAVDGHRPDHHGGVLDHPGEDGVDVASRGEVHDGVRPGVDGHAQFVELFRKVGMVCRGPDIGVDLCRSPWPIPLASKVWNVFFGITTEPVRHPAADLLRGYPLVLRRLDHLRGCYPFSCGFELCHDMRLLSKHKSRLPDGKRPLCGLCTQAHFPTQALP